MVGWGEPDTCTATRIYPARRFLPEQKQNQKQINIANNINSSNHVPDPRPGRPQPARTSWHLRTYQRTSFQIEISWTSRYGMRIDGCGWNFQPPRISRPVSVLPSDHFHSSLTTRSTELTRTAGIGYFPFDTPGHGHLDCSDIVIVHQERLRETIGPLPAMVSRFRKSKSPKKIGNI